MKRKKIIIISISLVITIIFAIFGGFLGLILSRNAQLNTIDFSEITGSSKKVILFIGDGMGVNHVKATSSYYEKQINETILIDIKNFCIDWGVGLDILQFDDCSVTFLLYKFYYRNHRSLLIKV